MIPVDFGRVIFWIVFTCAHRDVQQQWSCAALEVASPFSSWNQLLVNPRSTHTRIPVPRNCTWHGKKLSSRSSNCHLGFHFGSRQLRAKIFSWPSAFILSQSSINIRDSQGLCMLIVWVFFSFFYIEFR